MKKKKMTMGWFLITKIIKNMICKYKRFCNTKSKFAYMIYKLQITWWTASTCYNHLSLFSYNSTFGRDIRVRLFAISHKIHKINKSSWSHIHVFFIDIAFQRINQVVEFYLFSDKHCLKYQKNLKFTTYINY